jgi:hypothetical protein
MAVWVWAMALPARISIRRQPTSPTMRPFATRHRSISIAA